MAVLITADLHLSVNPRDEYRHVFMEETLPAIVKEHKPSSLIILGDLTDSKDCHSAPLVNRMVDQIRVLEHLCPLYILRGNHDCLDPSQPFFKFLGHLDGVKWINDPWGEVLTDLGNCLFLPHTRNYKKDWALKSRFAPFERDPSTGFIFCHNTFEGADAGHGNPLGGIPTNTLPKQARVISGDVHVPQEVDQVTYVGAPYTVTFGDSYKPRILLVERKGNKFDYKSIPVPGINKRTVELKNHEKIVRPERYEKDLLKVRVHLKASDYADWNNIQNRVRKTYEEAGAVVCLVQPVKTDATVRLNRKAGAVSKSDKQMMNDYAKRRGVSDDILKTGLWLMEKV